MTRLKDLENAMEQRIELNTKMRIIQGSKEFLPTSYKFGNLSPLANEAEKIQLVDRYIDDLINVAKSRGVNVSAEETRRDVDRTIRASSSDRIKLASIIADRIDFEEKQRIAAIRPPPPSVGPGVMSSAPAPSAPTAPTAPAATKFVPVASLFGDLSSFSSPLSKKATRKAAKSLLTTSQLVDEFGSPVGPTITHKEKSRRKQKARGMPSSLLRLQLLIGSQEAGNRSKKLTNDIMEMLDQLLDNGEISKKTHKAIYERYIS